MPQVKKHRNTHSWIQGEALQIPRVPLLFSTKPNGDEYKDLRGWGVLAQSGRVEQDKLNMAVERILERVPDYPEQAYDFLQSAFNHTLERARENKAEGHVNARTASLGFLDHALEEFGPMAWPVMREWNIRSSADVGRMVFLLIEEGVLGKSDSDSQKDFDDIYDMRQALREPFLPAGDSGAPCPQDQ